jgi:hypothetical protein
MQEDKRCIQDSGLRRGVNDTRRMGEPRADIKQTGPKRTVVQGSEKRKHFVRAKKDNDIMRLCSKDKIVC